MSSEAEVLINSAVKTVGKREFLKTVDKLFNAKAAVVKPRNKLEVPGDKKCIARVKGDRTGIKVGRFVLFDNQRCNRKELSDEHLCAIHTNTVTKFGSLLYGKFNEPLTEEQKKVFGEI